MTSSASYPTLLMAGTFKPSKTSRIQGTDRLMSSGVSSRLALYSEYVSLRNDPPGASNTTATCEGASLRMTSSSALVKPKMALVFKPFELIRGFFMKA